MEQDAQWMREALREAEEALAEGEIPVGAVIVSEGRVIARAHNTREASNDPTAHAEVLAIRRAAEACSSRRLRGMTLYVTLEPCPMCAGAVLAAEISRVVFGTFDPRGGCCGSVYSITEDPAFTRFAKADGGILEAECRATLERFFRQKRANM